MDVVFVPHNIDTERYTIKEILKKLRTLIYGIACTELYSQTLPIKTYYNNFPLLQLAFLATVLSFNCYKSC